MPRVIPLPPPAEPDAWATPGFAAPIPYGEGEFIPTLADLANLCPRIAGKIDVDDAGCWMWGGAFVRSHRNRRTYYGRVWWARPRGARTPRGF